MDGDPLLVLSLNKFVGWQGNGGWLRSGELDVRLQEARSAGFNALTGLNTWTPEYEGEWWYLLRAATPFGQDLVESVVQEGLGKPVLAYGFHHEFHARTSNLQDWISSCSRSRSAGSRSLCGDLLMVLDGHQSPGAYDVFELPLPEYTISEFTPDSSISRMFDDLRLQQSKWESGRRFVRAASITVVAEFASFIGNCRPRIPSTREIWRAFLLCVAHNVRVFDVLWGANQNITGCGTVEELRPQVDRCWSDVLGVARWLRENFVLLLDPTPWRPVAAVPVLEPPSASTGWVWRGVFAARKLDRHVVVNMNDWPTEFEVQDGPSGSLGPSEAVCV